MRISILLIFTSLICIQANSYSQDHLLSIDMKYVKLSEVFDAIEENSEFVIFYTNKDVNLNRRVTLNVSDVQINEVLDKILENKNTYAINGRQIVIKEKETKEVYPLQIARTDNKITVKGVVSDESGVTLPGVSVTEKGTYNGVITNENGEYNLKVGKDSKIEFSFVGLENQTIDVKGRTTINVILKEMANELDEVTVVAFGKQKKESVMAAIETVKPAELKIPTSNLTTALAGRMSGLISYQRSGEPGEDDASFFVRGVTSFSYANGPLVLIDGVEMSSSDLSRMQPDDIASFSIMKDAAATALYGARGANGVIMVTTKEGKEGKMQINIRHETTVSMPTKEIDLADPITYMQLNNEAKYNRDPLSEPVYSLEKIDQTKAGANPYVYPANDWYGMLFKSSAINTRTNFNISGGGRIARYYVAGTYSRDQGVLNVDNNKDFNNNIDLKNYLLRSNININLNKSTELVVRLYGTFKDYIGPLSSGGDMYSRVMRTDPVAFPAYYAPDEMTAHKDHILFGNTIEGNYINPYADMVKGYKEYSESKMQAQFEVKHNFDYFVKGLSLRALLSTNRYSFFDVKRSYKPYYYSMSFYDSTDDKYVLNAVNPDGGTEWLDFEKGEKKISTTTYMESAVNYVKNIYTHHDITALLVFTMRNHLTPNADNLALSLPGRNMGLAGRFTYSYKQKYYTEFNFGYNGSERFSEENRWGFFPSMGLGYLVSNEDFWSEDLKKIVNKLKLKTTYGLSGNDGIGDKEDRFFYLSEVNLNYGDRKYTWGENFDYSSNGVIVKRYPNEDITWETSAKLNVGLEVGLFDKLDLNVDVYTEHRTNILMERKDIPTTMGLQSTPKTNVGEAKGRGIDLSLDYNQTFNKDFWLTARANFTYAVSEFEVYEEVDRSETPWLAHKGHSTSQTWGFVAERLFIDENDVQNSPKQFGDYGAGDIKYKDINNDGEINDLDKVPIGHPTRPEIVYGFGFSMGYKGVDFSCFFQGLANESFWIDPKKTAPFVDTDDDGDVLSKNALLQVYADNHWSENNRDNKALWPRLSDKISENNTKTSTWFMRDGSFMRLKSIELGYSLPKGLIKKVGLSNARLYCSGTNLLTFSKFDLWDPEMAGNGLKYPIQKSYNFGVQVSF